MAYTALTSKLPALLATSRGGLQSLQKFLSEDVHHVCREDKPGTIGNDPEEDQAHHVVMADIVKACKLYQQRP